MKWKNYIFTGILLACFLLSISTDWYRFIIAATMVTILVMVLDKLGKGIVLRELIALHISFICLLMPLMGYTTYTRENKLAALWLRYMFIPEDKFFSFCVPAVVGFILALCWPMNGPVRDSGPELRHLIENGKKRLLLIPNRGIILMTFGIIVFGLSDFLSSEFQFAFLLFFFAAFAGLLYVYYQPKMKKKYPILALFGIFILAESLRSGMFTIVAYMGITLFSFFFLGRKTKFWKKLSVFAVCVVLLFTIQAIKNSYRKYTWREDYQGSRISLFGQLIKEQIVSFNETDFADVFFPIYYRANQGYNVSLVMNRIPQIQDFDNGHMLSIAIASSFVPRLFWPDKPEAGGRGNMQYYAGFSIEGWSTNVGPLGEAYGSFGTTGGIIYMILLGAFIRWGYRLMFSISRKVPLVLFWLPVIFYQVTYSAEADTLQIINSMVKSAFFVWILYKVRPGWFGVTATVFDRERKRIRPEFSAPKA